jgi:hypothetical protein
MMTPRNSEPTVRLATDRDRLVSKQPLTRDFLRRFDRLLGAVKDDLERRQALAPVEAHRRAQLLLERLLFLYFLQQRGWLDQRRDYLPYHFQPHRGRPEDFSYSVEFLGNLFRALASAPDSADRLPGIPFLDGGLFDDELASMKVRNATFARVFDELLEAFPFTAREDTPFDREMAVDPEMLGNVFESIVLRAEAADPDAVAPHKRKATGSYYTPRVVVHFICREVLRQYLLRHCSGPNWQERVKGLFQLDASDGLSADDLARLRTLLTPTEGAALRDRVRELKCCDPAVGSGAFPVGLLHELLALRRLVETAANGYRDPVCEHGAGWLYEVKEEIVRDCLFGVDVQQRAVEICRLRLALSLLVDCDPGPHPFAAGRTPRLPNLTPNFRLGDSLLCAWQHEFAEILAPGRGGFDIVVGNPPFVTARHGALRELYRARWPGVCADKYHLLCPFLELGFGLLRPGGELGFIVANAFAKREFGRPLVETFFPTIDLHKVIDCSGLLFPGHGTPTCLLFGSNRRPAKDSPIRVLGLLPGGGDLRSGPEGSSLWRSIAVNHDSAGFKDCQIVVADRPRDEMAQWPWFFDPTARKTYARLEGARCGALRDFLRSNVGYGCVTRADEVYFLPLHVLRRIDPARQCLRPATVGDEVRNWGVTGEEYALFPYDGDFRPVPIDRHAGLSAYLGPFRAYLEKRVAYGKTQLGRGLRWFEYSMLFADRLRQSPQLCYPDIATHGHFCAAEGPRVFKDTAPIFAAADPDRTDLLAGLVNSSAALFWLKQVCFNKGAGASEERDRYEFLTGKVEQLPLPTPIAGALRGESSLLADRLAQLARECRDLGRQPPALAMRKVLEAPGEAYQPWAASLPGYVPPCAAIGRPFATAEELWAAIARAVELRERLRDGMVARQEEMDWLTYAAYGLTDAPGPALPAADLVLKPGQRPFCLWQGAVADFTAAAARVPAGWSAARRPLWLSRLEALRNNEHLRRIEQPASKRRWDEQWIVRNRWVSGEPAYDAEFLEAFSWWLSEKAEWWLGRQKGGGPASLDEWAVALWSDSRVRAAWEVAEGVRHRHDTGKASPDEDGFPRFFGKLVKSQSVPEGIPFAVRWEDLPRVPAQVRAVRGRLNVPRERFWTTGAGRFRVARLA